MWLAAKLRAPSTLKSEFMETLRGVGTGFCLVNPYISQHPQGVHRTFLPVSYKSSIDPLTVGRPLDDNLCYGARLGPCSTILYVETLEMYVATST